MKLKVKKINPEARMPAYAHIGDAGMDLFSLEEVKVGVGETAKIKTGISIEIPERYVGLFWDKSGLSINHGIKILGGVIDSGYRGEIIVGVINLSKENYTFEKGHKVTQMLIQPIEIVDIVEAEELNQTPRGEDRFGSTGK
jgi:dUTP pyrophosphatase